MRIWPFTHLRELREGMDTLKIEYNFLRGELDVSRSLSIELSVMIADLEKKKLALELELHGHKVEAGKDIRSGKIMADNQQASQLKFNTVRANTQGLKKLNKQAALAIRYAAQNVKDNAIQGDLRAIAELIHPDSTQDIEGIVAETVMSSPQMTQLIKLAGGRTDLDLIDG